MPYLELRNQTYRIVFRHNGKKISRSLQTDDKETAELRLAQLKDGLNRMSLGLLEIDPEDDVFTTLMSTGRTRKRTKISTDISLGSLLDLYLQSVPSDAIEADTRNMLQTHIGHLKRLLGVRISIRKIDLVRLQSYINRRSSEPGIREQSLSPVTVKKEITTLYAAWSWGMEAELVSCSLPRKSSLRYGKDREKPPFRTYDEISRSLAKSNLTDHQARELWDCLYLDEVQTADLVEVVYQSVVPDCIKAMIATAAYTGMRRGELIRSQIKDVDLESGIITIREKKRIRGQNSTRRVPICEALRRRLEPYLDRYSSIDTFALDCRPLTRNQAHHYFKKSLDKSKWSVIRGWHCLRHSFISCLASKGVDQRILDDFVGHQTEAMRKRYRHLFPDTQKAALEMVYRSSA